MVDAKNNQGNKLSQLVNSTVIKVEDDYLTPAQKKFNRLTKGLQRDKQLLSIWKKIYDKVSVRYTTEFYPLLQEVNQFRLKMLLHLDKIYQESSLSKPQQKKLLKIIKAVSEQCIGFDSSGQAEAIYDRYNDTSYDEVREEFFGEMREDLEEMLGIDLGDDFDFNAADAVGKFMDKLSEKAKEEEAKSAQRKAKKQAKDKKKESTHSVNLESHSLRDVFRKLAKVLHPDREQDEQERLRKSELMQRANVAYEKKDLLSLLELQIEIEQANQSDMKNLTEEKLKAYNKLLQSQNDKLKQEIQFVKQSLNFDFNIPLYCKKEIEVFNYFDLNKQELLHIKRELINDLKEFQDIKQLKAWLNVLKANAYFY